MERPLLIWIKFPSLPKREPLPARSATVKRIRFRPQAMVGAPGYLLTCLCVFIQSLRPGGESALKRR